MAKETLVLDTSIVVKWFVQEVDTAAALRIRENVGAINTIVPDLLLIEFSNALRWNKKFTEEDVQEYLLSLLNSGLTVVRTRHVHILEAIAMAFKTKTTVYDALFLAFAKLEKGMLVTSDEFVTKVAPEYAMSLQEYGKKNKE